MRDRILIWGCGGHGKVVADLVRACGFEVAGFVDQDVSRLGEVIEPGGARLVAKDEEVESCLRNGTPLPAQAASIAVAVGDVDNQRLILDLQILMVTIWKVVRLDGITQEGQATMERFRGEA